MQAVYFDLDGTLTDPKPGITRSIRYALERLNRPAPPEDELAWCIGPPLRGSLAALVGEADADRALAFYRERFTEVGLYENSLYPGIAPLLAGLQGRRRLFVATSKPLPYATRILSHFGLDGFFERVFGPELDGTRADKSALLAHALRESNAADGAIMVGDREHDMIGAANNGMTGYGVLYGYGGAAELRAAGAHCLFATPEELRAGLA